MEIILKPDGKAFLRQVDISVETDREIDLTPSVLSTLPRKEIKLAQIAHGPGGAGISLATLADDTFFAGVRLRELVIKTRFAKTPKGVKLTFLNEGETAAFKWLAPDDMSLMFGVHLAWVADHYRSKALYLAAFDTGRMSYRIPLPNLHTDCAICTNSWTGKAPTIHGLVNACIEWLFASEWNTDLFDGRADKIQEMFQFQQGEDGVLTTIRPRMHWTKMSEKFGTPMCSNFILP